MGQNLHATYETGDVKAPSERSTGLVFAVVWGLVAWWFSDLPLVLIIGGTLSICFALVSFLAPQKLRLLNQLWFKFSLRMHKVMSPIIMFVMFVVVIVPAGLLMRVLRDPLLKKPAAGQSTYWVARDDDESVSSMVNQF